MATTPTTTRHYQRSVPADQHAATRDLMRCVRTNRPDTVDGGPQRLPLPDEKPRLPYLEANLLEALAWPTLKAPHPPTAPSLTLGRITTSWTDLCPAKSNLWVPWAQQHQVTEALISIGDPPMPRRNTALLVDQTAQVRWDMVADNTTRTSTTQATLMPPTLSTAAPQDAPRCQLNPSSVMSKHDETLVSKIRHTFLNRVQVSLRTSDLAHHFTKVSNFVRGIPSLHEGSTCSYTTTIGGRLQIMF